MKITSEHNPDVFTAPPSSDVQVLLSLVGSGWIWSYCHRFPVCALIYTTISEWTSVYAVQYWMCFQQERDWKLWTSRLNGALFRYRAEVDSQIFKHVSKQGDRHCNLLCICCTVLYWMSGIKVSSSRNISHYSPFIHSFHPEDSPTFSVHSHFSEVRSWILSISLFVLDWHVSKVDQSGMKFAEYNHTPKRKKRFNFLGLCVTLSRLPQVKLSKF